MPEKSSKRKPEEVPSNGGFKKQKKGHGGKWKTSHQIEKVAAQIQMGKALEAGDRGLWVTYARGMKIKAVREFTELCYQYAESMYGISQESIAPANPQSSAALTEDIEVSIEKELSDMKAPLTAQSKPRLFTPVSTGIDCVFFMKVLSPVDPAALALQICEDAYACEDIRTRKCRYINRINPVTESDKATDSGIVRVAQSVLLPHFTLADNPKAGSQRNRDQDQLPFTYAIRYNIRNHDGFKSDDVVRRVAGLISPDHKVNLGKPDKVILIEIFQLHCGLSVVDGQEWEKLKKYNVNALYEMKKDAKH